MGYRVFWRLHHVRDHRVPQLRTILVGITEDLADNFEWPKASKEAPPAVGQALHPQMAARVGMA